MSSPTSATRTCWPNVGLYGAIDTHETLRNAMARLARLELPPQAIVFTGDLADRAEPKAYVKLREIVEPAAAEIGAEVVWVMGNHDEREHYARELFGEEITEDVTQDRVHDIAGLRVISLDTSVPGYHHGEISPAQLAWLTDQLATPAEHGTVLAMHHPPIPVPMVRAAEVIELHDQHLLAEVIEGTDVRGVIAGHFHFSSYSTFAGVPVSVASSTCYLADPAPAGRLLSAVDGHQSVTMMHFYDDRVVHSVVPVRTPRRRPATPTTWWSRSRRCRLPKRARAARREGLTGLGPREPGGLSTPGQRDSTIGTITRSAYAFICGRVRSDGGASCVSSSDCASRARVIATTSMSSSGGTGSRCARSCRIRSAQNAEETRSVSPASKVRLTSVSSRSASSSWVRMRFSRSVLIVTAKKLTT